AEALRAELVATRPGGGARPTRVLAHWSQLLELGTGTPRPDVVVVAPDRAECDRAVTDTLLRRDLPHLLVRPLDGGAQVGPFVLPGTGCCTRCTDLYRAGRDPRWPAVLAQLIRQRSRPEAVAVDWAVAAAVVQVLAALHGHRPDLCGHTLELDARDWSTRLRRWPAHPGCGCDLSLLER
ncbi:hypothetical protein, partial [Desertihabitans aurantiacus]|uniref:hypothetical protein n=1 Tax=Desertihabitans aurantiacus TaxID=2282477 RepID=UPI001E29FA0D